MVEHSQGAPRWKRWLKSGLQTLGLMLLVVWAVQTWQTRNVAERIDMQQVWQWVDGRQALPQPGDGSTALPSRLQTTTLQSWMATHAHGQPVLIHVWAEWCPICKIDAPMVDDLVSSSMPVLTVATRSGDAARVQRTLQQKEWNWPAIIDRSGEMTQALGMGGVPAYVILTADGQVHHPTMGATSRLGLWLRWWAVRWFDV